MDPYPYASSQKQVRERPALPRWIRDRIPLGIAVVLLPLTYGLAVLCIWILSWLGIGL